MTVDVHSLLTAWPVAPFAIVVAGALLALAAWYLDAAHRLEARGRHWSRWRTVAFLTGLASVEVALGSPVATLTMSSFSAHMFQHLLLMAVGPPLAALGAPSTLALQTSSRRTKRVLLSALHSRPFAVISHPVPVFFLYYLSMYAFFLTGAVGFAMGHMWVMDLANLGFLGGATLFWWPMVGLDPIPRGQMSSGLKIINLLIGVPVESFLGIALLMSSSPVAPMYTLGSTHAGGGLFWASGELVTAAALLPIFFEWSRLDARLAKRIDARIDAGETVVSPVTAGQGMAATLRALRRG